jgi:hypothetical protein
MDTDMYSALESVEQCTINLILSKYQYKLGISVSERNVKVYSW